MRDAATTQLGAEHSGGGYCKFGCQKFSTNNSGLHRHEKKCFKNPVNAPSTSAAPYRAPLVPNPTTLPKPSSGRSSPIPGQVNASSTSPIPDPISPSTHSSGESSPIPEARLDLNEGPPISISQPSFWINEANPALVERRHAFINGAKYYENGKEVLPGVTPVEPSTPQATQPSAVPDNGFFPFNDDPQFRFADILYRKIQASAANTDGLIECLASHCRGIGGEAPFDDVEQMHDTIDAVPGITGWEAFEVLFDGEFPENPPGWMTKGWEVWYRNPLKIMESMLENPDFAKEMDWAPKRIYTCANDTRRYRDLMSADWAWNVADDLAQKPDLHGAMLAPVVLGSDKTTVSVATGQNEYYPLYASLGNLQNQARRGHRNGVALIAFLAIPKASHGQQNTALFRLFRRQVIHTSVTHILLPLKPWMETPRFTRCGDGFFRYILYRLGPYIGDYPEQCLIALIVYGWCPRCTAYAHNLDGDEADRILRSHEYVQDLFELHEGDLEELWNAYGIVGDTQPFTTHFPGADIHQLLSPDILHQVVKGVFKDHLVTWVVKYIEEQDDGVARREQLDQRIKVVPPFPELRRFHDGRNFKQWTGNDSKALMKVFLPAIDGLVPPGMVRAVSAFMEFCYLVRRSTIDHSLLSQLDEALSRFHKERQIFKDVGIREDFNLPRQHSLIHYRWLIQQYGAPNGLCSSITESKHIKAVKEPYRRSNHNQPLGQMALTNQRLDALHIHRTKLIADGLLDPEVPRNSRTIEAVTTEVEEDDERLDGEPVDDDWHAIGVVLATRPVSYPPALDALSEYLGQPKLSLHIRRFLYDQLYPDAPFNGMEAPMEALPEVFHTLRVQVFSSASATFYAPSDLSGIHGMRREYIRATPNWRNEGPRHDCIFVRTTLKLPGFRKLHVAQVIFFFSFTLNEINYPCALVEWFVPEGDAPSPSTGLWVVSRETSERGKRVRSVIHLNTILRAAHLIGVAGETFIPNDFKADESLGRFKKFYVNKYADYQAHEVAF
ncbi:hypothetical protein BDN72DRAFT_894243 [Pluteus cervinus]|uniref:Uncharacterized protein n=1 Tax=Pluteus cervinus TaxID=181527 RepID=A0ACD3B5A2_9AGAR|nr:hypothetical protein BDN72DRAFT_894243 [Pluteus cervinus]